MPHSSSPNNYKTIIYLWFLLLLLISSYVEVALEFCLCNRGLDSCGYCSRQSGNSAGCNDSPIAPISLAMPKEACYCPYIARADYSVPSLSPCSTLLPIAALCPIPAYCLLTTHTIRIPEFIRNASSPDIPIPHLLKTCLLLI